jgi:Zn-dependent protease
VFERGYLTIARFRGAPIRIHWSTPVGALVFTRFMFLPGAWLGFFLIVLLHELGHAVLVRAARMQVVSIDVLGFGGLCRWYGVPSPRWRALIAWGGVFAQALLLVGTLLTLLVLPPIRSTFLGQLFDTFLWTNGFIIALNLLPIPPLDGAEAWPLLGMLRDRRPKRRAAPAPAVVKKKRGESPVIDDAEADRLIKAAIADAAREAEKRRRDGRLH